MTLKTLRWQSMSSEPYFKGKGVKLRTFLLHDKRNRIWEVQANKRTFPILKDKYPDAVGWCYIEELLLPDYSETSKRVVEGKDHTVIGYKTMDCKELEYYYEQECKFSKNQFHSALHWQDMAMYWRRKCWQLEKSISK